MIAIEPDGVGDQRCSPISLAAGATTRHRPWQPSFQGCGHLPPLVHQAGGVVYAYSPSLGGTKTVSFANCTITGNSANGVRLRQPAMMSYNDRHSD